MISGPIFPGLGEKRVQFGAKLAKIESLQFWELCLFLGCEWGGSMSPKKTLTPSLSP